MWGEATSGTWELYFDGSDVALCKSGKVFEIHCCLFAHFYLSKPQKITSFFFKKLFAVYLTGATEDIWGVWADANGDIYLTTQGAFAVSGSGGDGNDIFICTPGSLGTNTTCTFSPGVYWDGAAHGFLGSIDALMIE